MPQPPSSTMLMPSTRTSLFCDGMPLMVIEIAERHWVKSRLRLVSWTPGRMPSMPKMSRPLVGMFAMSSSVSVDRRELSATWTGVTSDVIVTVSVTPPICSVSLPRSRTSVDSRSMSATFRRSEAGELDGDGVAARIQRGEAEETGLVGGRPFERCRSPLRSR